MFGTDPSQPTSVGYAGQKAPDIMNAYFAGQQHAMQTAQTLEAMKVQQLKDHFLPEDLYMATAENRLKLAKEAGPLNTGLITAFGDRATSPVQDWVRKSEERLGIQSGKLNRLEQRDGRPDPESRTMDIYNPKVRQQIEEDYNRYHQKGGKVPGPLGASELMSPGAAEGQVANDAGPLPQKIYNIDDLVDTPPAPTVADNSLGYQSPSSGMNMQDPMIGPKIMAATDPSSLLSESTEKVLPAYLSMQAMQLRNLPGAQGSLEKGAMADVMTFMESLQRVDEAKRHNMSTEDIAKAEAYQKYTLGLIQAIIGANKPPPAPRAATAHAPKDPNYATDAKMMQDFDNHANQRLGNVVDKYDRKQIQKQIDAEAPGVYRAITNPEIKKKFFENHQDALQKAGVNAPGGVVTPSAKANSKSSADAPIGTLKVLGNTTYKKIGPSQWSPVK